MVDVHTAPVVLQPDVHVGYGHVRGGGSAGVATRGTSAQTVPMPLPPYASLGGATPEDRQRAVARLLSRDESFSLEREEGDEYELTPDKSDDSPSASPRVGPAVPSVPPPEISFTKEEVVPVRPAASGLAGIHRPSMDGRPVIQTPNRYAIHVAPPVEYSDSGRKKRSMYKISLFLPTKNSECLQLELKQGTTAAQAVVQALAEYLRTHTQPERIMLGQPGGYRMHMAEEDGELDDSFPPLDPTCVVSTTSADCFILQKRVVPTVPPPTGIAPASLGSAPAPPAIAAAAAGARPRVSPMAVLTDLSHSDPFRDDDADPTARPGGSSRYLNYLATAGSSADVSVPPVLPSKLRGSMLSTGGSAKAIRPKSHRTSSDADEEFAQAQAEMEADEEEQRRVAIARANGAKPLTTKPKALTKQPSKGKFSLRSCLSCACFAPAPEEVEAPLPSRI